MRILTDVRIDELRDEKGYLFGRAPAQEWVKPDSVIFRQKTFRNTLEGSLKHGSELEFVIPWSVARSRWVKPNKSILEDFLLLAVASEPDIHKFASRFGPLMIYCEMTELDDHAVIVENCLVWRYFAACMKALLGIAAALRLGRAPNPADWDAIAMCPPAVLQTEIDSSDWFNASPRHHERAWNVMASIIRRGQNRNFKMWAQLLNALLGLGRVRPWVNLKGSGASMRPGLIFTGPNLLSYLAMQLCLLASEQEAFAVCSHCNRGYPPAKRAPKAGQRNYCPDCRKDGAPVRVAQRTRRQRLRDTIVTPVPASPGRRLTQK